MYVVSEPRDYNACLLINCLLAQPAVVTHAALTKLLLSKSVPTNLNWKALRSALKSHSYAMVMAARRPEYNLDLCNY